MSIMLFDSNFNRLTTFPNTDLATLMLYTLSVHNPVASDRWKVNVDFSWWQGDSFNVMFSQHSAESAVCYLGVRYKCN